MRLLFCRLFLLLITSSSLATVPAANDDCTDFSYTFPKQGPLASINCDFHHVYENRIKAMVATFGEPGGRPVILNLGGTLIFKHQGKQETVAVTPLSFHNIKAYTHAPFSAYLILSKSKQSTLDEQQLQQLKDLQKQLSVAVTQLDQTLIPLPAKKIIKNLTDKTQQFLAQVIHSNQCTQEVLQAYFDQVRPQMNQLILIASYTELSLLDKTINRWLAQLTPEERKKLGVVLAVSHQARAQEISLQFFAKHFGFQYGEGAALEQGFVVMENNFDEKAGLAMLARHYLDREVATVILGDPNALQVDLLSKAAQAILRGKNETNSAMLH